MENTFSEGKSDIRRYFAMCPNETFSDVVV
jgi:hypothetical protein